ncbi:response regulator [Balneatrix alpica]|uniref:response regulator n=1 Tax=Balneatrix alpica TaxID=75684 RepID=UPI0027385DD6|nr:response regulator [Balneatrix alpica]
MLNKKKVLFIDSNGNMRFTMKSMLRSLGIEHLETQAPAPGLLKHIQNQHYDFVIVSHNEQDRLNGIRLLEEARYHNSLPEHTAWILLVADTSKDLIIHVIDSYPDDILTKPFTANELQRRLESLAHRQDSLKPLWDLLRQKRTRAALALCDKVDENHQNYLYIQQVKARLLMANRRHLQAAHLLSELLKQYPRNDLGLMLSYCLFCAQEYEQSIATLGELLAQSPLLLGGYDLLSKNYLMQGDVFKARYWLQWAVSLSARSILRLQQLGYYAFLNTELDVAEPVLQKAVKLAEDTIFDNKHPILQLADIGRYKVEQGDAWQQQEKELVEWLRLAHKRFPDDKALEVESAWLKGQFYKNAKQMVMAEQFLSEAEKLAGERGISIPVNVWQAPPDLPARWVQNMPEDPELIEQASLEQLLYRGRLAYQAGHLGQALSHYAEVLQNQPEHADAMLNMTQLFIEAARDSSYQRDKRLQRAKQYAVHLNKKHEELSNRQRNRLRALQALLDSPIEELPQGSLGDLLWEGV